MSSQLSQTAVVVLYLVRKITGTAKYSKINITSTKAQTHCCRYCPIMFSPLTVCSLCLSTYGMLTLQALYLDHCAVRRVIILSYFHRCPSFSCGSQLNFFVLRALQLVLTDKSYHFLIISKLIEATGDTVAERAHSHPECYY